MSLQVQFLVANAFRVPPGSRVTTSMEITSGFRSGGHANSFRVPPRSRVTTLRSQLPQISTDEPKTIRPLRPYLAPDKWCAYFSSIILDEEKFKSDRIQVEVLKEEVRKMLLTSTSNPVESIKFINLLGRLGVSYHFEDDIEKQLSQIFNSQLHVLDEDDYDLYTTALVFRVFRQHGFKISCDIFKKYQGSDGKFKESLLSDPKGMLYLYEAAHYRIHGEDILDQSIDFTKPYLQGLAKIDQSSYDLDRQISDALMLPYHSSVARLEARKYIEWYERGECQNETLLKFAKLDFNTLQFVYQRELKDLANTWWKDLNIAESYSYTRDRITETFYWATVINPEPQYERSRMMIFKFCTLATVLDDTYDSYGTYEELTRFYRAIQRWDYNAIDELPDYMKPLYKIIMDAYYEFEKELALEGTSYSVCYMKEEFQKLIRGFCTEIYWLHDGYTPSFEEYLRNAFLTIGVSFTAIACFMGMGKIAGTKEFELLGVSSILEAMKLIVRLLNDLASRKNERDRPHILSSVEYYMKQNGVSEKETIEAFEKLMANAWKDVNEESMRPLQIPKNLHIRLLNILCASCDTYRGYIDVFSTITQYMVDSITKIFVEPIPL